ncbi:MAG: signal peptidase I [Oscillospiraceae bacterium]
MPNIEDDQTLEKELLNQDLKKLNFKKEAFQWLESIVVSVIIVALILTFVGAPRVVKGNSMNPSFKNNDKVITTNIYKELKYGDVVVIRRKNDDPLIKRVIGVAGDTIDIDFETGCIKLNNSEIKETYINELTKTDLGTKFPTTVPSGCLFVMGDNRNHSDDSRDPAIGMIDKRNVFGKVVFRFYPFDAIGAIKTPELQKAD